MRYRLLRRLRYGLMLHWLLRRGLLRYRLMLRRAGLRLRSLRLVMGRLRLANGFFRTHGRLHLAFVRRLILVLRRLTRCLLLPIVTIWGVINPMNANFTYAFNIVIEAIAFRLFVIARLHTF
ncbi:hypothetical protein EC841_11042 [Raoultella ornithinolytica]|uniref:Uncharacterized protein n=1 Tax=Raoultella ornithinolytica TaxID=54291 RepID=A0ABD7QCW2_RAOOR|nr:hypothetical protein EC841_11042 [Raoultella ornithinolytica]